MADMRQIFTYPIGIGTDYIDPLYVGNSNSGLTRRIDELLDGTYKAWLNTTAITATTSEVMQNISKFGSYYENQSYAGHLSRYDFWKKPLVVATKKLIDSEDVLVAGLDPAYTSQGAGPLLVETTTAHEFEDGLKILGTNIDGTWGGMIQSGQVPNMYADVQTNTTFRVATEKDADTGALSNYIEIGGSVFNFMIPQNRWHIAGHQIQQTTLSYAVACKQVPPYTDYSTANTTMYYKGVVVDLQDLSPGGTTPLNISDGDELIVHWNYLDNWWLNFIVDDGINPQRFDRTFYLRNTADTIAGNNFLYEVYWDLQYDSNDIATASRELRIAGSTARNSSIGGGINLAYPLSDYSDQNFNQTTSAALITAGQLPNVNQDDYRATPERTIECIPDTFPAQVKLRSVYQPSPPPFLYQTLTKESDRYFTLKPEYARTWSDGRLRFGTPDWDATNDFDQINNVSNDVEIYYLDPVDAVNQPGYHYVYRVTTDSHGAGMGRQLDPLDFRYGGQTGTVSGLIMSFYHSPQTANAIWTNATNGRIKWPRPSADAVVSVTNPQPIFIDGGWQYQNEYQNNPYYLKDVPSLTTSTYRIFDVYKDQARTQLYTASDYSDPGNTLGTYYAKGSDAGGAGATRYIEIRIDANNPYTTEVMKSNASYPGWNINSGDTINANWTGTEWIVTSHTAIDRTFNDRTASTPAPSLDITALESAGNPLQPRFWIPLAGNTDITSSTNGNVINWTAPTGNIQSNISNLPLTDLGVTSADGTHQLYQSADITFKTIAQTYPKPAGFLAFRPDPRSGSGAEAMQLKVEDPSVAGFFKNLIVRNAPTSYPARNSSGEYQNPGSGVWDTNATAPIDYPGAANMYLEVATGSTSHVETYTDFNRFTPALNFQIANRTATGPTNLVNPAGNNYPTNIDTSNTNVVWDIGSIAWKDAQEGQLIMSNPVNGATTLTQTFYIKNTGIDPEGNDGQPVELYTDAALTTAYTSADFITDWAPFIDATDAGRLQFLTKEFVSWYAPGVFPVEFGYSYMPAITDILENVQRQTNSTDVFDFNSWAPEQGSASEPAAKMYDRDGNQVSHFPAYMDQILWFPNVDLELPFTDSTTGQVGPDPLSGSAYEIDTVSVLLPGNEAFFYQSGPGQRSPGALVNTNKYWEAGSTTPNYYGGDVVPAQFVATVGAVDGYLMDVTLTQEPDAEGRYPTGEDICLFIDPSPDQYTPPVETAASRQDDYDTHDEWTTDGYNELKQWPNHISPSSANIVYSSPTIVNNSQNGIKYTRSSAHTKWILEVEYPPMSAEDFREFSAVAQAAHGQSTPFHFKLRNKDDVSILWADMMDTDSSLRGSLIDSAGIGDTVLFFEGLTSNDPNAFASGEVFKGNANENGHLYTTVGAAASNVFGEAKIRMPWPLQAPMTQTTLVYKNPEDCVVTLNSDSFEYSVDVNNYYTVSVTFDLDNWK